MLQIDPLKTLAALIVAALPILAVVSCSSFSGEQAPTADAQAEAQADSTVSPTSDAAARADASVDCTAIAPAVLGNDGPGGGTDQTGGDTFDAYPFVSSATGGTLHCAHLLVHDIVNGSAAIGDEVFVGVYDDATGRPGSLLATGKLSLPPRPFPALASGPLDAALTLDPNKTYWIAVGGHPSFLDEVDRSCNEAVSIGQTANLPTPTWPKTSTTGGEDCNVAAYFN